MEAEGTTTLGFIEQISLDFKSLIIMEYLMFYLS